MRVDTKRLHFLVDDGVALLVSMLRSGVLSMRERLSECGRWARMRTVEVRWEAILEQQLINKTAREKEMRLAKQLADPVEATVLLDDEYRLVAANQVALSMLGISERNIGKFTIDAFLSYGESGFERMGRSLMRTRDAWRKCRIRRLDSSSFVGEFVFQANVAPGRHLSTFRNVVSCRHVPSQVSKVRVGPN
jgi:PAS domain-containing protein